MRARGMRWRHDGERRLSCMYGWFLFAEPLSVFESLDRAVK